MSSWHISIKHVNENLTRHLQTFTGRSYRHQTQSLGHLWTQSSGGRSRGTLQGIRGYSAQQEGSAPGWLTVPNCSCTDYKMKQNLHSSPFHRKPATGGGGGRGRLILVTIHLLTSETSDAAYETAVAKSLIKNMKLLPLFTAASCFTPPGPSFFVLQVMKFFFQITWARMKGENPARNRDGLQLEPDQGEIQSTTLRAI